MIRFQEILKHADSEIGNLNTKKMALQEELAKEEAEEQQKQAQQTLTAQVWTIPVPLLASEISFLRAADLIKIMKAGCDRTLS